MKSTKSNNTQRTTTKRLSQRNLRSAPIIQGFIGSVDDSSPCVSTRYTRSSSSTSYHETRLSRIKLYSTRSRQSQTQTKRSSTGGGGATKVVTKNKSNTKVKSKKRSTTTKQSKKKTNINSTTSSSPTSKKKQSRERSWTSSTTSITGKWKEFFILLQSFQSQHGHTRVPYNYTPNPQLGRWVARQRMLFRNLEQQQNQQNKQNQQQQQRPATALTPERIEALQSIQFSFESPRTHTWSKRFDELCLYKSIHGDCLVPKKYDLFPGLGVWVRNQRTLYRNIQQQQNKKGLAASKSLSKEKISALQSIGFVWDTQRNDLWKKRYDELLDFRNVHGHCFVPEHYHENPQLGTWVVNQRTSYKNFLAGLTHTGGSSSSSSSNSSTSGSSDSNSSMSGNSGKSLTKEKIMALESIGFCWAQTAYNWYSMFYRLKQYKEEKKESYIREQKDQQQQQQQQQMQQSGTDSDTDTDESDIDYDALDDIEDVNLPEFFQVPPEDVVNRDLRLWIAVQRKEYSNWLRNQSIMEEEAIEQEQELQQRGDDERFYNNDNNNNNHINNNHINNNNNQFNLPQKSNLIRSAMTPRRIRALESIGFPWNVSKNFKSSKNANGNNDGPTVDDWTKLFEQMREQGIDSNMRPKEHWFEGQSLVMDGSTDDKKDWTDEDLLELWNMEGDDDD